MARKTAALLKTETGIKVTSIVQSMALADKMRFTDDMSPPHIPFDHYVVQVEESGHIKTIHANHRRTAGAEAVPSTCLSVGMCMTIEGALFRVGDHIGRVDTSNPHIAKLVRALQEKQAA